MDTNSASLAAALHTAMGPNYLGDLVLVDSILRELAQAALNRRATLPIKEAKKLNEMDFARLADAFLGNDTANYTPMTPWNSPGQIDRYIMDALGRRLGWPKGRPERTLKALFNCFVKDMLALEDYAADPNVPQSNWDWQVPAIVESYRNLLIGLPDPPE